MNNCAYNRRSSKNSRYRRSSFVKQSIGGGSGPPQPMNYKPLYIYYFIGFRNETLSIDDPYYLYKFLGHVGFSFELRKNIKGFGPNPIEIEEKDNFGKLFHGYYNAIVTNNDELFEEINKAGFKIKIQKFFIHNDIYEKFKNLPSSDYPLLENSKHVKYGIPILHGEDKSNNIYNCLTYPISLFKPISYVGNVDGEASYVVVKDFGGSLNSFEKEYNMTIQWI